MKDKDISQLIDTIAEGVTKKVCDELRREFFVRRDCPENDFQCGSEFSLKSDCQDNHYECLGTRFECLADAKFDCPGSFVCEVRFVG